MKHKHVDEKKSGLQGGELVSLQGSIFPSPRPPWTLWGCVSLLGQSLCLLAPEIPSHLQAGALAQALSSPGTHSPRAAFPAPGL